MQTITMQKGADTHSDREKHKELSSLRKCVYAKSLGDCGDKHTFLLRKIASVECS